MDEYTVIWRPTGESGYIASEVLLTESGDPDDPFDMEELKEALYQDYCATYQDDVVPKSAVLQPGYWELVGIARGFMDWVY